jgi:tetratricopeptide (TPR) repeat protein
MAKIDNVIELLKSGKLVQAKEILEEIIKNDPTNIDALYNLGMCFTELDQPDKAILLLKRCVELKPDFDNAFVALGFAYERTNDSENAKKYFLEAVKIDPNNSYALRNLGGLFGKLSDLEKSIYYLEKSYRINTSDPMTVYGLGHIYKAMEEYEKADEFFRKVLALDGPENIKDLAKDGLREIAISNLKSKGFRIDAVFYLLAALQLFKQKRDEEIKNISFEIALKGREGLDINDPQKKYRIKLLEGEYTGLQLVCYMYAGFKRIDHSLDVGIDLSKEYQFAMKLFSSEDVVH